MIIWLARTLYRDPDTGDYLEEPFEMFLERVKQEYPRAHVYVRQDYYRGIEVHCWDDEGGDSVAHAVELNLALLAQETLLKWAFLVSRQERVEEA
jgi:hypothetical protein